MRTFCLMHVVEDFLYEILQLALFTKRCPLAVPSFVVSAPHADTAQKSRALARGF